MKSLPRILPLVGIAIGGVLAVNALAGAQDLPGLLTGARAFAEEAAKSVAPDKGKKGDKAKDGEKAETGDGKEAAAVLPPPSITPKAVCAPTAAELAKAAGLSPAELQVLQSLGERRGQLDARESDLSTQIALMSAAEAKLDAKIRALNGLKGEVQNLLTAADGKEAAEVDRLVKVFESMKAKDAAPRLTTLDDSVRIPIAAKMKERALSAILAQMAPAEAKRLTESLARRFANAQAAAAKADQIANAPAAAPAAAPGAAPKAPAKPPARKAAAKAPPKKAPAAPQAVAAADTPAPALTPPPAAPPVAAAAPPPAATPPAKAG